MFWFQKRKTNGVAVLLYHRVANLKTDPQLLAVSTKNFKAQMEFLGKNYQVISVDELMRVKEKDEIDERTVVVSFDDGYVDNYNNALPVLKRQGLGAVFFVSTGLLGKAREFWWDNLERVFLLSKKLPDRLSLAIAGEENLWVEGDISARKRIYEQIHRRLLGLPPTERDKIVGRLMRWARVSVKARKGYESMSRHQVAKMASAGLTIGAHTVTHSSLGRLERRLQEEELVENKSDLERTVGREVAYVSYPYGTVRDLSRTTVKIVRKLKFRAGFANIPGLVRAKSDKYKLPRNLVRNWRVEAFKQNLESLFGL